VVNSLTMTNIYWASTRTIGPQGKQLLAHIAQSVLFLNFSVILLTKD